MDISSGAILDFFVTQRAMYTEDLEREGCREALGNLLSRGLKIKNFVTDQNTKIAKLIRESPEFKAINHCYDVWHMARNLKKKLEALEKKHPKLKQFRSAIINHFWYSCQNCDKDPATLVERFHSILLHI